MYKTETLILGSCGAIMPGARMVVSKPHIWVEEESLKESKERQEKENASKAEDASQEILDSHERDLVPHQKHHRVAWQLTSPNSEDVREEQRVFKNVDSFKKLSNQIKHRILQKACHQQFEFRDGCIVNCSIPNLVLGVQRLNLHSGSGVVLARKKSYDKYQKWLHKEESRTFHLMSNPNLVLAVALPTGSTEDVAETTSYPVIVQRYKPYGNGASNQKWLYLKNSNVLKAFYSTKLDIEITTANLAGVCTSTVAKEEKIDQVGYHFHPPGCKTKIRICLACAQSMVNRKDLKKLPPGNKFACAFGSNQGDLSSCKNENSPRHYEELLLSFKRGGSTQTLSHNILAAMSQRPVKVIAHKNGAGSANGKLIVAHSFPVLLSACTTQLGLTRAASRLYTYDGTTILNLNDLILWAVNESLKHKDSEEKKYVFPEENKEMVIQSTEDKKPDQGEIKLSPQTMMSACLHSFNTSLLTLILKNPIEVWVSCGEPFIPLDALQRSEKLERKNWLKKDRILADLEFMKHKMRQLKGRRVFKSKLGKVIYTNSPARHTVVKGNWMEPTQEERKLLKHIVSAEAHLSEVRSQQTKRHSPGSIKQSNLYIQPNTKRVFAYLNGREHEDVVYAWGRSIAELLDSCSLRLRMTCPAKTMFTLDGKPLTSWNDIKRDMVICVSAGNHFVSHKDIKRRVAMRANYAHVKKLKGAHATDIVVSAIEKPPSKTNRSDSIVSLYTTHCFEGCVTGGQLLACATFSVCGFSSLQALLQPISQSSKIKLREAYLFQGHMLLLLKQTVATSRNPSVGRIAVG
ncbi:doublecortin domain-containing protein 1 [Vombatus ursinus]|uniref:doublecortin domain-containing protein 1 n=1 Tax=Vombatus ursinus TaxID=29139 RepID=UPI000FFD61BA|nr:doublecortin domain-containing protein 1 [Vombatus ursinus]